MSLRLTIFDLDDTLSDHHHSSMCGIRALQERFSPMAEASLDDLVALYREQLNRFHAEILAGRETSGSARPKRYWAFLEGAGVAPTQEIVKQAIDWYRQGYAAGRRAVPGAAAVLEELRERRMRTAVLTNHYSLAEQRRKLAECELTHFVDDLFVSAELGLTKPDPAAFQAVLDACGAEAAETVMVGDSLASDVEGALAAGIRAVWLNRHGTAAPDDRRATVLEGLEPVTRSVPAILGAEPDA